MKNSKQQKPINSFFKKKEKKDKDENKKQERTRTLSKKIADAANKENTITLDLDLPPLSLFAMGCKSQDRKSAIQKAKEHTYSIQKALREAKANGQRIKPKNAVQRKLDGTVAEPRCDDPDNPLECTACTKKAQYEARGKTFKGFAHHYSCPHNKDYLSQLFGEKSESTKKQEAEAARISKNNNMPLSADLNVRKEDGIAFFSPKAAAVASPTAAASPTPKAASSPPKVTPTASSPPNPFEVEYLTNKIRHFMQNPTASMKRGKTVPNIIGAAIETLLEISPRKFKRGTNTMLGREGTDTASRYDIYKKHFKPGTLGFTFPKADITKPPDAFYSLLEGVTVYVVSWETNMPGVFLPCHKCDGEMIHQKFDWSHGYATPIFDVSGKTDWAASMQYQCNSCPFKCKANDGRLISMLNPELRMSYPVDPRYATGETHMTITTTRIIDDLMVIEILCSHDAH